MTKSELINTIEAIESQLELLKKALDVPVGKPSNWSDLFDYDDITGVLTHKANGREAGWVKPDGTRKLKVSGKSYLAHYVVWEMFNGEVPKGFIVNHKDSDRRNNVIENLELVSKTQHLQAYHQNKKAA